MDLIEKLRQLGAYHSIDYIGVAGIEKYHDDIAEIGGRVSDGFPRALSIGIALSDSIVDGLRDRHTYENVALYDRHAYHVVNDRLNQFASVAASALQREGYRALPLPASDRIDSSRICASVSHKLIARLAGFGWIGKSCLLITPEHGPRVRWTTVLTDAPLEENREVHEVRCGDCAECVKVCPPRAFTGRNYVPGEPRELRYDAGKCEAYVKSQVDEIGRGVCGMCLYSCPYGRSHSAS